MFCKLSQYFFKFDAYNKRNFTFLVISQQHTYKLQNKFNNNIPILILNYSRKKNFRKESVLAEGFQFKGQKVIVKPYIYKML